MACSQKIREKKKKKKCKQDSSHEDFTSKADVIIKNKDNFKVRHVCSLKEKIPFK